MHQAKKKLTIECLGARNFSVQMPGVSQGMVKMGTERDIINVIHFYRCKLKVL